MSYEDPDNLMDHEIDCPECGGGLRDLGTPTKGNIRLPAGLTEQEARILTCNKCHGTGKVHWNG